MAGEQAVLFVDAALALFSPPGPYHGQQELRVGQLSGERGAGRKRSRSMDCTYREVTLGPLLDLNLLSSQFGEPGADNPHST